VDRFCSSLAVRQAILPLIALLVAAFPAAAAAAPPNDNYLASSTINRPNGSLPLSFHDIQDTSTATTQPDTFNPDRNGQPLGGGPPEITTCGAAGFGKTIWYDFAPPTAGAVKLDTGGFDNVVTVYRWDPRTSRITETIRCQNSPGPTEQVLLQGSIHARRNYTIQIGGVNGIGGMLDFRFTFFPDTDGDGVLDEAGDQCPHEKGTVGGCPPTVRAAPSINFNRVAGGLQITSLVVDHVAQGGRVEVRCGHCGHAVKRRARRAGSLSIRGFVGRTVRSGDFIEVRATQPKQGRGRLRYGAVGRSFRWPVKAAGLGRRVDRCLAPGTNRRQRCP
jgi:hypothetical protein